MSKDTIKFNIDLDPEDDIKVSYQIDGTLHITQSYKEGTPKKVSLYPNEIVYLINKLIEYNPSILNDIKLDDSGKSIKKRLQELEKRVLTPGQSSSSKPSTSWQM